MQISPVPQLSLHVFRSHSQIRSLEQQKTELEEQNMHLTQRLDSLSIHSSQSVTDSGSSKGVSLLTELSGLDHTISNDSLDAISPENQQVTLSLNKNANLLRHLSSTCIHCQSSHESHSLFDAGLHVAAPCAECSLHCSLFGS